MTQTIISRAVRGAAVAAALAWTAPLAAQQGGQVLSPPGTANATVGGAKVTVTYSRPSVRGRQVFGSLVPYGQVWRTGANSATTLVTSKALKMGTTTVPAGTYTLYTIPEKTAWTLVVNKQTGQWGTEYDKGQDLARIPMKASTVATPVEQFTIALAPSGANAGVLAITWDRTRAEAPFTVAP